MSFFDIFDMQFFLVSFNILTIMKKLGYIFPLVLLLLMSSFDTSAQAGCTDARACNFDPSAMDDDGTCAGWADFNCDHITDVRDYLIFMKYNGCTIDPATSSVEARKCDLDNNGVVGASDWVMVISSLGNYYPEEY
jgi:hypothetical protein